MAAKPMFEVDVQGLRKLIAGRGKSFLLFELFQNAADESVTRIDIRLEPIGDRRGRCRLVVADDSPEGFHDITHAYTLFAESKKKGDAGKRGRFNLGEKLVLALCEEATISTTTGTVVFKDGERQDFPRRKRDAGTVFQADVIMTRPECEEATRDFRRVLVPADITLVFNGEVITAREPRKTFEATLPTVLADEEGTLRPTRRKTTVEVHDGDGWLYEMGIPVVQINPGSAWDINVMQKVPLNTDRDNVTPSYAREVRAQVLNHTADLLSADAASEKWVDNAMEDDSIDGKAVEAVMTKRFGEKRVIHDPSDPEGTKLAMSKGYTVIPGRAFSKQAWGNIRSTGAALPAGQVTPSPKPYSDDPDAKVRDEYPREKWTPGMERIVSFTEEAASKIMGVEVDVILVNVFTRNFGATYCRLGEHRGQFEFNVARLGKRWFEQDPTAQDVLDLIIHEFGHQYESDHLSESYYKALTRLGAKMTRWALNDPNTLRAAAGLATA
jgi:hypothetical protein